MGFFDLFRISKSSSKGVESKFDNEELSGLYQSVEIVGESFYVDAFKMIRGRLGNSSGSEAFTDVVLKIDPGNEFATDGKAVAVYVMGQKVGHVSSAVAGPAFDALQAEGGSQTFSGRIYFGDLRQNPPKNSVSISWEVQIRTPEQLGQYAVKYQKSQEKREADEVAKEEFLKRPIWSDHTLAEGDRVTFTGFTEWDDLEQLTEFILGPSESPKKGAHLLVVHPEIESSSAKLRNWLSTKKPATNLETFVRNNPQFGQYFNEQTLEFDVPPKITGKKEVKLAPTTQRVFESDTTLGHPRQQMPSELVLLPEQTLATHPPFTNYGSISFRLSDVKLSRVFLEQLFLEVGGGKTDSLVLRGALKEIQIGNEQRVVFEFRGTIVGYVPKNETQSFIRDSKTWRSFAVLGLISWSYKNIITGEHDAGLSEAFG